MKRTILTIFVLSIFVQAAQACTSAIITGKITPDGRPLMWKHRDSDSEENKLMFFKGTKYDYTGVVNSSDSEGREIWMGSNSAGFSIMNTMSYNLEKGSKSRLPQDQEGLFMKAALERCGDVEEFERFLKSEQGKWGVYANFGVVDAKGGAAYFETGNFSYTKFDVNDPKVAPQGFLIRTNFSFSGTKEDGLGYFRYNTAANIFNMSYMKGSISLKFVLFEADRNLEHSLLKNNLYKGPLPADTLTDQFIPFRDYIVRNSSVSSMIIQGVKPGEDPRNTVLWTVLGFPMTTLVTPVWVSSGSNLPKLTLAERGATAPINYKSLVLKKQLFPVSFENGKDYLNYSRLLNQQGTGIAQKLLPAEKPIVSKAEEVRTGMIENGYSSEKVAAFYKWLDEYIIGVYKEEFGI